jgi:hypothetical protein
VVGPAGGETGKPRCLAEVREPRNARDSGFFHNKTIRSKEWNVTRPGKTVKQKVIPPKLSKKGLVHSNLPEPL